jgi:hypothetical protein
LNLAAVAQICAWLVAIIGGLVAAFQAVAQMRRSNVQRLEDMRWKRAEMAKKCLDQMWGDGLVRAAMKMLDWDKLSYVTPQGRATGPITHEARRMALRITGTEFRADGDELFIRDAFDALFDGFQMLEHLVCPIFCTSWIVSVAQRAG